MLKFMVVLYKKPGMSEEEFHRFLREVHGPMALKLPGLRRYVQNHVVADAKRAHPGWSAIVELYFDNREAMEAAWATSEGGGGYGGCWGVCGFDAQSVVDCDRRRICSRRCLILLAEIPTGVRGKKSFISR